MSDPDQRRERIALLDLLISEHRDRGKAQRDRLASTQTTISAIVTGTVAVAAFLAPRLPYDRFQTLDKLLVFVSALAACFVVVAWIDALGGPLKSVFEPYRVAVRGATTTYEEARTEMDPVAVRTALLEKLLAEEALGARELTPREEMFRFAVRSAFVAMTAMSALGLSLAT